MALEAAQRPDLAAIRHFMHIEQVHGQKGGILVVRILLQPRAQVRHFPIEGRHAFQVFGASRFARIGAFGFHRLEIRDVGTGIFGVPRCRWADSPSVDNSGDFFAGAFL